MMPTHRFWVIHIRYKRGSEPWAIDSLPLTLGPDPPVWTWALALSPIHVQTIVPPLICSTHRLQGGSPCPYLVHSVLLDPNPNLCRLRVMHQIVLQVWLCLLIVLQCPRVLPINVLYWLWYDRSCSSGLALAVLDKEELLHYLVLAPPMGP